MIHIEVDTQAEIVRIGQRLERLAFQAPDILRLSINAAARKVRKQITKDVEGTYTIKEEILKDRKKGAPTLQTAKPGNVEAVIRSKGPVNDLIDFLTRPTKPSFEAARAKVMKSGGLKLLERGGAPAVVVEFESGHVAVVQRVVGKTYTVGGAAKRVEKYGMPRRGQWPDMTKIKKLLGPSVPSMIANEEVQERAREMLYTILDQEIDKRIAKAIRQSA